MSTDTAPTTQGSLFAQIDAAIAVIKSQGLGPEHLRGLAIDALNEIAGNVRGGLMSIEEGYKNAAVVILGLRERDRDAAPQDESPIARTV